MEKTKYHIIGGGMSGIMTALRMQQAGYTVELISDQPDPRSNNEIKLRQEFGKRSVVPERGSTWGGGPTRMVSPSEGDVYLGSTSLYPDMLGRFKRTVSEGGWLDRSKDNLSPNELVWINKRTAIDNDSNAAYINELREFYIKANLLGMKGWQALYDSEDGKELFADARFTKGIFRSYGDYKEIVKANDFYNLHYPDEVKVYLGQDSIETKWPFLLGDQVAGVFELPGYSFNAQNFLMNTLDYLERNGAILRFNTALTKIEQTHDKIDAIILKNIKNGRSERVEPQYGSIHIGAYDPHNILQSTPAAGAIMGVSGLWGRMHVPEGMTQSMKVHFNEGPDDQGNNLPLTDLNLIYNEHEIVVGSGYIFTGETPYHITDESKKATYAGMRHALGKTIKDFAASSGYKELEGRICTRHFTNTDQPLIETMETRSGGRMVIYGGDNTGTTSMAPAIAEVIQSVVLGTNAQSQLGRAILKSQWELRGQSDEIIQRAITRELTSPTIVLPTADID